MDSSNEKCEKVKHDSIIDVPIEQWLKTKASQHRHRFSELFTIRKRHIILFMCMMVNAMSYTMRTNLNLTIVAMVKEEADLDVRLNDGTGVNPFTNHTNRLYEHCPSPNTTHITRQHSSKLTDQSQMGKFEWSESLQGTILGAYYYGYIVTNINGGQLADYVGTKLLLFVSVLVSSVLTLLVPLCANLDPYWVVANRIVTGLAQGVVTPSLYTMLSLWTPQNELGLAFALIQTSGYIGAVVTMPICAYLSEYGFAGGWPSVFYVLGAAGVLFLLPWLTLVHNSPQTHPNISTVEKEYIQNTVLVSSKRNHQVPWRSILTSPKIWSIGISKFCSAYSNLFLMSKLPAYLGTILHMPIDYNGYVNASIYITIGTSILIWGRMSDWIDQKKLVSRTTLRKMFQSVAMFGSAAFMAAVPVAGCDLITIVVMLNMSMLVLGMATGGESLVVVDVAPDYSGSIYGFTNAFASLPGFLAPLLVGVMLDQPNVDLMHQWSILFWIGSLIYCFGALVFILFVNSIPEPWGHTPTTTNSVETLSSTITDGAKIENSLEIEQNQNDNSTNQQTKPMEIK